LTHEQRDLVTRYMPLARALARQAAADRSSLDEFEAEAYAALVDAARSFDPDRGVHFAVHARIRIRGALRDYRRFLFHAGWRGEPEMAPVFERLNFADAPCGQFIGMAPEAEVGQAGELHEAVESVIRRLPRAQAAACRLIYIEGKSGDETASALGLSAGYVSRLHGEALAVIGRTYREALAG